MKKSVKKMEPRIAWAVMYGDFPLSVDDIWSTKNRAQSVVKGERKYTGIRNQRIIKVKITEV